MSCKCLGIPFFSCYYCENKFYKYLEQKNKKVEEIRKNNKLSKVCKCFLVYQCDKCTKDIDFWYNNVYCCK